MNSFSICTFHSGMVQLGLKLTPKQTCFTLVNCLDNHIGGVMVSVLVSSVIDRGFELRPGQTKDYEIGIWLARNQNNVSE